MKCKHCGNEFEYKIYAGREQIYCCKKCKIAEKDKRYRIKNRDKRLERDQKYRDEHRNEELYKKKSIAWNKLNTWVKSGKIIKSNSCQICGRSGIRIEAHHYMGYDYPLDVIWLCCSCHIKAEKEAKYYSELT